MPSIRARQRAPEKKPDSAKVQPKKEVKVAKVQTKPEKTKKA